MNISYLAIMSCALVIAGALGNSKNIEKVTVKMNISHLAIMSCALVIAGALGNSLAIGYSTVKAQQEAQQPSTITSPWSKKQSSADLGNAPDHNTISSSSQTFTNLKNINLIHSFVSNKVVGPDRFRFLTSYWTAPDTSLVDVGTSANDTFLAAGALPPNQKLEVDTNEGFSTLAVVLEYDGVVNLAGITAALKLPAGFKAVFPLTDDRNNYNIALSSYRGHVYPGQGIVLYFSVNILPTAKVQLSVLGPLALHFLRSSQRAMLDSIGALEQNMFAKTLSVIHTRNGTLPNSTFNRNFDFSRDYFGQFGRLVPYDFVNQVIPVIFKVTGQETLDIVTLPPGKFCESCKVLPINATTQFSNQILKIPSGVTTKIRLALRNTGDVPFWYADVNVDNNATNLQSTLGINGLNPSAITSPNIPQTLFSTMPLLGITGPEDFGWEFASDYLNASSYVEFDVTVFPSHYAAGTVQVLNVQITGTNVIGEPVTENRQVYVAVAPP